MKRAFVAAVLFGLMFPAQPALASRPDAQDGAPTTAPIASVGSRVDSMIAPSQNGRPPRMPDQPLDQAAYARAKADAAKRARGLPSYTKSDFSISASPASQTVVQGSSAAYNITTATTSGIGRTVALSVSGLPSGATGTFSPAAVTAGQSSTLTITTTTTTPTGTSGFTITGAYASPPTTHSTAVSLTVAPLPPDDFSISASPANQTVVQGASVTYNVTTQVTSGNAKTVSLSLSGLPSGATGTLNPASVVAGQSSMLTITTTATTTTGTFTLTITGAYASPPKSHSASVSLTVTAPASDFSISASPSSQSVVRGASTSYTVSTQDLSGTAPAVSLSLTGLPAGVTGTFNPASFVAGNSAVLTVVTTAGTATGTFTLTITGTSSATTQSTAVSLTVSAPPDFSISASPATRTVTQGGSTSYAVSTQDLSGTPTVSLSVSGLAAGASGAFNPASVLAGQSSTLTITTTATATTGTVSLTITGVDAASGTSHTASVSLTVVAAASTDPTIGVSFNGQFENDLAPPDPTGAIGTNTFIQLINSRYGIHGRDGGVFEEGDLGALTLFPVIELSDPQIVWDPTSQRFYYLVLDFYSSAFAFGYSKTADPRSAADFCHYSISQFYSSFYTPDYPKMAVTRDFVLIGSNVFLLLSFYMGSDVDWFQKPTNPVCPASLGAGGIFGNLKNANGTQTSTPEPAVSADGVSGDWIIGSADVSTGSASFLTAFKVTKNAQGYATISGPTAITVDGYQMPANAPQSGTTQLLDTMDTRLTHAVAGYDPRIGATAIWTAHTVFGGAGAEARWYEITTAGTPHVAQSGRVTDAALYIFNGAISPDRAADDAVDASAATGRNMVIGFNTSSAETFSAIQMASQRGVGAQSGFVMIRQSVGPYVDFACGSSVPDVCRWGDYGGAVPDPLTSAGGQVWLSGEWNEPATDGSMPTWRTWNWSARP